MRPLDVCFRLKSQSSASGVEHEGAIGIWRPSSVVENESGVSALRSVPEKSYEIPLVEALGGVSMAFHSEEGNRRRLPVARVVGASR
jgi:hypothetical protein